MGRDLFRVSLRKMETTGHLVIPCVDTCPEWIRTPESDWVRSYAGIPLVNRNQQIIGFLNLNSARTDVFNQATAERLSALAHQAAIALGNARLYDRARHEINRRVRALKKERNLISAILDTADAFVIVLNRQGNIVRFNRACERTTGYSFHEVRDKPIWEVLLIPQEAERVRTDILGLAFSYHRA